MRNASARRALAAGAALAALAACAPSSPSVADRRRKWDDAANNGISDWSNITNNMMVEKYGAPDRVDTDGLVWFDRGPWKKIEVWDELNFIPLAMPSRNLEQTIVYPVPAEKRDALLSFSSELYVSADGGELSARSTSEERNFLMLNLADEIVQGLLSPKDARAVYLRTLRLADAGKTSPSMKRLLFQ
jgi:hypothetical protein